MSPYRYTDTHFTTIGIGDTDDGHDVIVRVRDNRLEGARVRIPADERQAAAQAVAGDAYRVVPAGETADAARGQRDRLIADVGRILDALGLTGTVTVDSPHNLVERDVLPAIKRLQQTANMPGWERELLAGQSAQEEIDQLKRDYDALEKRLREAEAQPDDHARYTYDATCPKCRDLHTQPDRTGYPYADGDTLVLGPETFIDWPDQTTICHKGENYTRQTDRPEPVDPASVRVGDYVHVESVDRYVNIGPEWAVQGAIGQDHGSLVSIRTDDGWISVSRGHGVWYVLQPAEPEPEPDEAAVEALYQAIYRTPEGQRQVRDNQDGRADEYRAIAEGLVRAGLEVPSDG